MSEHVAYLGGVFLGSVASVATLFTTGPETTVHADLIRQANEVCLDNIGLDKIELGGKLKLTRIYCLNGAEFPMGNHVGVGDHEPKRSKTAA